LKITRDECRQNCQYFFVFKAVKKGQENEKTAKTAKTAKRQGKAIKVMRKKINKSDIYVRYLLKYLLVCKPFTRKKKGRKKRRKKRQSLEEKTGR
jgi:hypothetical protein